MKRFWILLSLLLPTALSGAIRTQTVEYRDGDTVLEGFVAWDDAVTGKRPGILVVHQWMGLTDYERKRCEMLAGLGYVAFAADIYGKGVRPANPGEAGGVAGKYKNDRPVLRGRVNAGLEKLKALETCDASKTAAIGYCFGGTTVLELARSGAEVAGVVSFHGGLGSPTPADASRIRGKVLALHGADDPFVPVAEVAGFEKEMRDAKCDWQLVAYGGAVHSFTHWTAGTDNSKGAAYNEKADKRSWSAMKGFFEELFR
jgi:dienelactone hydrolase